MVTTPSTKPTGGPRKPRNQPQQTKPEPKATKPHPKPEYASEREEVTSDNEEKINGDHKGIGANLNGKSSKASKGAAANASKREEAEPKEAEPKEETEQQREMRQLLTDLANHKYKNVVVMAGAGISTASGIPDFRSPKTGLYANLQKFKLPYPEAVFDISYLRKNPDPFFMLCSEMYPTKFKPTRFHHFLRWLNDLGALKRCYTQNIDTLERLAGVPESKIVEAHGSFQKNFCIDCKEEADKQKVEDHILAKRGVYNCDQCDGIVKPGIVFFGEALPAKFFECMEADFESGENDVDLVIVAGTSLQVGPFNQLPDMVPKKTKRYLINYDQAGSLGKWRGDKLVLGKMEGLDDLFDEFVTEPKEKEDTKVDKQVEKEKKDDKKKKSKKSNTGEIIDLIDELDIN